MPENFTTSAQPFFVRRFEERDREAVLSLWPANVMHLQPDTQPIALLIDSVEGAIAGRHHVWVAETLGRVIGSAAVVPHNACEAHLKFLCVDPEFADRDVLVRGLASTAIKDAWERGYLKLVVHTPLPPSRVADRLHDLGFEFSREHSMDGEHVLEFYQNLYQLPQHSREDQSI